MEKSRLPLKELNAKFLPRAMSNSLAELDKQLSLNHPNSLIPSLSRKQDVEDLRMM